MIFLLKKDMDTFINGKMLEMITGGKPERIDDSERLAIGFVSGKLAARYNMRGELGKTGDARNQNLIRWIAIITVYYLYSTVPDVEIPEWVQKNFDFVSKEVIQIAAGKDITDLAVIASADGQTRTRFRWGSSNKRSHNPFGGD